MNDKIEMNSMKSLSIIIVTYNSKDYIKKCLDSVFFYNDIGDSLEIIIVDNSSEIISLEMKEYLQREYKNLIIFLRSKKNGGYGYGNNLGIQIAKGKYIAIMNPDITITEPYFQDVIDQFENNDNLGMLGYKQIGGYDTSYYLRQEFYFPFFNTIVTKICNRFNWFNQKYMYLSGANFFTKKELFQKMGGFDEAIFLYFEESDITKRFLQIGKEIRFDKSKKYRHEIDERQEMSGIGYKFYIESCIYYLNKYSFSSQKYFRKLKFELKLKKLFYKFNKNTNNLEAIENQLKQLEIVS